MSLTRRSLLQAGAATVALGAADRASSQASGAATGVQAEDRVFICNEDSNTLSVIDPRTNAVETTVNLTSFDEDARPPFRFVTGGVAPGLPPAKWSSVRYGSEPCGGLLDVEEAAQARRDRREAAAG